MPIRVLDESELEDIEPIGIQNTQGVTFGERFTLKNLAANPQAAKAYLKSLGYQVRSHGSGFNFAVRKSDSDPWEVVDPDGFDAQDLFDLIGDAIGGFLTTAGTAPFTAAGAAVGSVVPGPGTIAGAGAGTVIGSGLAGAGVEMGRQTLGALAGIPENVDLGQAALVGGVSAAVPVAGKALGAAGRGLRSLAYEGGARFAGIPSSEGLLGRDVLREGARQVGNLPSYLDAAKYYRKAVQGISTTLFPESVAVDDLLTSSGKTVNLRPLREALLEYARPGAAGRAVNPRAIDKAVSDPTLNKKVAQLMGSLRDIVGGHPLDAVPAPIANRVKRSLQELASSKGAYGAEPMTKEFTRVAKAGASKVRLALLDVMKGLPAQDVQAAASSAGVRRTMTTFGQLMKEVEKKTRLKVALEKSLGKDLPATERFVTNYYGKGKEAIQEALQQAEGLFGVPLQAPIRGANIASRIGPGGIPELIPGFSSTGGFRGAQVISSLGGGAIGAATGLGAIPGALAGGLASSPKTVFGITGAAQGIGSVAEKIAALAPSGTGTAVAQTASQGTVRESAPKKRRMILGAY